MSVIDLFQALFHNLGVDLGRRDIAVTQQELNGAQVRAALQQVGRERVPYYVGRQRGCDSGLTTVLSQNLPEANPGSVPPRRFKKREETARFFSKSGRPART